MTSRSESSVPAGARVAALPRVVVTLPAALLALFPGCERQWNYARRPLALRSMR